VSQAGRVHFFNVKISQWWASWFVSTSRFKLAAKFLPLLFLLLPLPSLLVLLLLLLLLTGTTRRRACHGW
jgi:hypothetical protein